MVAGITFVQFEAVNAERNEILSLIVCKNRLCFITGKIRNDTAPYHIIAAVRSDVFIDRCCRMRKCMLPEIDMNPAFHKIFHQFFGVRELIAPEIRAGIGMCLPAGFQPEDIERDVMITEIICHFHDLCIRIFRAAAIENTKSPFRDIAAAAGEHIILADDIGNRITLHKIDIHTLGGRNQNTHDRTADPSDGVEIIRIVMDHGYLIGFGRAAVIFLITAIDLDIACGIEIHPVALVRDKKRNRGMAVTVG